MAIEDLCEAGVLAAPHAGDEGLVTAVSGDAAGQARAAHTHARDRRRFGIDHEGSPSHASIIAAAVMRANLQPRSVAAGATAARGKEMRIGATRMGFSF